MNKQEFNGQISMDFTDNKNKELAEAEKLREKLVETTLAIYANRDELSTASYYLFLQQLADNIKAALFAAKKEIDKERR